MVSNSPNIWIRLDFPDIVLHSKLGIAKNGSQYIYGKRDLFGLVIAFRYLLPKNDFLKFKHMLKRSIDRYCSTSTQMERRQLMAMMGFPENWEHITRYKI